MGERLTNEWTPTAEEAFGATGAKGRKGELFLIEVFKKWGWDVVDHEDDYQLQIKGIDLSFRKPTWKNFYTCDVKNNMNEWGTFYVYRDWLNKIEADRIFHVNPDTGWIAWYDVKEMKQAYAIEYEDWKYVPVKAGMHNDIVKRAHVDFS